MLQDAIAVRRAGIVATMNAFGAGQQNFLVSPQPGAVARVLGVRDGAQHPVQELLHRHMTEAAFDVVAFVTGATRGREEIIHAHVVRERNAELVAIRISTHKLIEGIANGPRLPGEFEKEVIHRQIERVDHAVFAFVDDPERFAFGPEQLRVAEIAMGRLGDEEFLVVIKTAADEFAIPVNRQFAVAGVLVQSVHEHILKIAEVPRVRIRRRKTRRDKARIIEAERERETFSLTGWHGEDQRRLTSDHEQSAIILKFGSKDIEALAHGHAARGLGGITELGSPRETEERLAGVGERTKRIVAIADAENQLNRLFALAIVVFDPTADERSQVKPGSRFAQFRRIWHFAERRKQGESKSGFVAAPRIARPTELAFVIGAAERSETAWRLNDRGVAGEGAFLGFRRSEKREQLPFRVGAAAVADVDVLFCRASQRMSESARGVDQTNRETRKGTKR